MSERPAFEPSFRLVLSNLFGSHQDFTGYNWQPFRPGVEIARLYGDGEQGASAALLRYAPGAAVPRHEHTGHEHILVLQGAQRDDRATYPAGTCLIHGPGTNHAVASEAGCIALAIWHQPIRVLEP